MDELLQAKAAVRGMLAELGAELSDCAEQRFDDYCGFLLQENEKYNLTAITEPSAVWQKHFLDSMLGATLIKQGATVCDIGCGAGFPSVPLKILRDDIRITLVDSLDKRVKFCRSLCDGLELPAEVLHDRAEDFSHSHAERFDVATARAVAPLNVLLEYTAAVVKLGGIVLAYKTDESEVASAKNAADTLGLKYEGGRKFTLPDGSSRCLLVYRKIKHTPSKYPRGQNKPRKQPL